MSLCTPIGIIRWSTRGTQCRTLRSCRNTLNCMYRAGTPGRLHSYQRWSQSTQTGTIQRSTIHSRCTTLRWCQSIHLGTVRPSTWYTHCRPPGSCQNNLHCMYQVSTQGRYYSYQCWSQSTQTGTFQRNTSHTSCKTLSWCQSIQLGTFPPRTWGKIHRFQEEPPHKRFGTTQRHSLPYMLYRSPRCWMCWNMNQQDTLDNPRRQAAPKELLDWDKSLHSNTQEDIHTAQRNPVPPYYN